MKQPLVLAMRTGGLITDYTTTQPLTQKQRVSINLNNFAANKRLFFTSGYNLNDQRIRGISIDTNNFGISKDPQTGKLAPGFNDLIAGTLFLFDKSNKNIITLALTDLVEQVNGGKILRVDIDNLNIGASYVIFSAAGSLSSSYSLPFIFHYS